MTADPLAHWAEIDPRPTLALDYVETMLGNIYSQLIDAQFEDPQLPTDLMNKVLTELRIASQTEGVLGLWAGNLLQSLWHRAESGIPFGEPQEPAWSLDPEQGGPR